MSSKEQLWHLDHADIKLDAVEANKCLEPPESSPKSLAGSPKHVAAAADPVVLAVVFVVASISPFLSLCFSVEWGPYTCPPLTEVADRGY